MNPHHTPDPHDQNDSPPAHPHDARPPSPAADPADTEPGAGAGDTPVSSVHVHGLADLIAAVPYVLTYQPHDAVVVMVFAGPRLAVTAALPLPPDPRVTLAAHSFNRVLAGALTNRQDPGADGATRALVLGYGPATIDPLLTGIAGELAVPVEDVVRVHAGRWWSLTCPDPTCCPPGAPVTTADHLSLALTVAGGIPAPTRADRARDLHPTGPLPDQVTAALAARTAAGDPAEQYELLEAARAARVDGDAALSPDEAAGLLRAVSDVRVRDACILWHDPAAVRLWLDLVRMAPPGWVAPAATLLALAAYRDGDSVLANLAIDRALDDDPRYPLAGMVLAIFGLGIPPQQLTRDLQEMAEKVQRPLTLASADPHTAPDPPAAAGVTEEPDGAHRPDGRGM